jgi:hypothetical protein
VNERRNKLCDSLNNAEQDRYAAHLEAFGHKKNWNPVIAVENVSRLSHASSLLPCPAKSLSLPLT